MNISREIKKRTNMTNDEEKELQILTKKSSSERKRLLKLFSKLTLSQQKKVLEHQRSVFHKLKNQLSKNIDNTTLTLASLIIAIGDLINSLNSVEFNIIRFNNRKAQKEFKTQKLLTYWSIVKELKTQKNMSFREISDFLQKSYRQEFSYSLIHKIWVEIEKKEVL
jgi:hypothetical protein